jgi:hypothetical protein
VTPARLRRSFALVGLASVLSLVVSAASGGAALAGSGGPNGAKASGASADRHVGQSKPNSGPANLIDHGGPVLLSSHTVAIFWGPTADFAPGLQTAMTSLLGGMNGSAYLGVVQQYMRSATAVTSTNDPALHDTSTPPSKALNPNALGAEVAKLVQTPNPDTIYFVFTSNMPHISYCAYHSTATPNGVLVQVAYVPLQPAGCSPFSRGVNLGANSYVESVQAAADSAAHEFIEAVTDPHLNAWYDKNGAEIADKCEYDYQGVVYLSNGSHWQIQSNWSNTASACDPGLGH